MANFQASFVTSQLWIVRDFQPIGNLESKIALPGELCHGSLVYGSVGFIFRENLISHKGTYFRVTFQTRILMANSSVTH